MSTETENNHIPQPDAKLPVMRSAYIVNVPQDKIIVIAENIAEVFDKCEKAGFKQYGLDYQHSFNVLE